MDFHIKYGKYTKMMSQEKKNIFTTYFIIYCIINAIIFFIGAFPISAVAEDIVVRKGWKTQNKHWMGKDAKWLKTEQKNDAKWRKNDADWKKRDNKWISSDANPNVAWQVREKNFHIYDGG